MKNKKTKTIHVFTGISEIDCKLEVKNWKLKKDILYIEWPDGQKSTIKGPMDVDEIDD